MAQRGIDECPQVDVERQLFLDDIDSLPEEAQRQVMDLVASVKKNHLPKSC
jgi:hypothetical protein